MSSPVVCHCEERHLRQRVVLTGGPGAGKTAVLELVRQHFCEHVVLIPEAASTLFAGGFRRGTSAAGRAATQRAIFHVQQGLEHVCDADSAKPPAIVVCDRGTVDGYAYWPGPDDFFTAMGSTRERELERYSAVIHLRTPPVSSYNHQNPFRIESALEAVAIDARIVAAWEGHPRRFTIESSSDFLGKARQALSLLEHLVPRCCRPVHGTESPSI